MATGVWYCDGCWVDHRFHLVGFDDVLIVFGVKTCIQG